MARGGIATTMNAWPHHSSRCCCYAGAPVLGTYLCRHKCWLLPWRRQQLSGGLCWLHAGYDCCGNNVWSEARQVLGRRGLRTSLSSNGRQHLCWCGCLCHGGELHGRGATAARASRVNCARAVPAHALHSFLGIVTSCAALADNVISSLTTWYSRLYDHASE